MAGIPHYPRQTVPRGIGRVAPSKSVQLAGMGIVLWLGVSVLVMCSGHVALGALGTVVLLACALPAPADLSPHEPDHEDRSRSLV